MYMSCCCSEYPRHVLRLGWTLNNDDPRALGTVLYNEPVRVWVSCVLLVACGVG